MDATDKKQQLNMEYHGVEPCVRCGEPTPYTILDSVVGRLYYVEGSGQLCQQCWNAVYNKDSEGITQTD